MEKEKVVVDHYRVLGLSSGEEGSKLDKKQIKEAFRARILQLQVNDPYAEVKFQRLKSSYAILKDPKARKQFDDSKRSCSHEERREYIVWVRLPYLCCCPGSFSGRRKNQTRRRIYNTLLSPCF
ncbi:hypothetical protein ACLB2K_010353 [Fragaria x ananassa]